MEQSCLSTSSCIKKGNSSSSNNNNILCPSGFESCSVSAVSSFGGRDLDPPPPLCASRGCRDTRDPCLNWCREEKDEKGGDVLLCHQACGTKEIR